MWHRVSRRWFPALIALGVAGAGCGGDSPTGPGGGGPADPAIGDYVASLQYDGDGLLNVQNTGSQDVSREEGSTTKLTLSGPNGQPKVCYSTPVNLKQNFDKVAILRPTAGVIYPGALVKANQSMMDGVPEPATLPRAPVTLSIDLPGMGDHGIVVVDNPTNSAVQAAIDNALEWWNANAYQDGYVNPSNSSYKYTSSYSSQQTALDVGLNMSWATGDFSGQFQSFTSEERTVVTAAFQQAFYTVTFDTPLNPEDVFSSSARLSDVQAELNESAPPAYVSSVVYGRILVFRMENTHAVTSAELEAAFNYGVGKVGASGDLRARYESILSESKIEVVTLGGNAEVASNLVTGDLISVITGPNATYSRSNPGVPIAYTVRYLKDDSPAKMGYTTDYTKKECFPSQEIIVNFANVKIPGDCDGIEGAGDFQWSMGIYNGEGTWVGGDGGSATVSAGNYIVLPKKQWPFVLKADQKQEFKVIFVLTEWDKDILGNVYEDSRMDHSRVEWTHYFRNGAWDSMSRKLTIGSSGDCKAEVSYSFTASPI